MGTPPGPAQRARHFPESTPDGRFWEGGPSTLPRMTRPVLTQALTHVDDRSRLRLMGAVAFSAALSLSVVLTSWGVTTRLGVPQWWPWLLTGLQVTALWAAGAKRWWGWLLGAAVQPVWITYALLTAQLGFIPGCAISAAVQTFSFLRREFHDTEWGDAGAEWVDATPVVVHQQQGCG